MRRRKFRYRNLMVVLVAYLLIAGLLFVERSGIHYQTQKQIDYLDHEQVVMASDALAQQQMECLVLTDKDNLLSISVADQFERIFLDMKVRCHWVDVNSKMLPHLKNYRTVVVLTNDMTPLGDFVDTLLAWVENGGRAMFPLVMQNNSTLQRISYEMGCDWIDKYIYVENFRTDADFMLGGDQTYSIDHAFYSSLEVELTNQATPLVWVDDEYRWPLLWKTEYGKGRFVVVNLGLYEKSVRGFYAAAYSMLEDAFAYPVLNGSVFYLDDFPSPVPGGDGTYIRRDYGMSISEFYTNIWWPEMLQMAQKHGVVFTSVVIQNYDDKTDGVIMPQRDTHQFQYFGNQVLRYGGEIGFHGYNHQPLCLSNINYRNLLPYNTWENHDAMEHAVRELVDFCREVFPLGHQSVYVPPSNVLSAEGRELLAQRFPEIRTIASSYLSDTFTYMQEFEVSEDGMVEQPRFISGLVLEDYMRRTALSELNMHLVNTHFMHPDDLLDEARGAALGWAELRDRLNGYMDWLYDTVPPLRNMTGSELSGVIQRYGSLAVHRELLEDEMRLKIDNYVDEANFLVRLDGKKDVQVQGGQLKQLTNSLYLLCADQSEVILTWER